MRDKYKLVNKVKMHPFPGWAVTTTFYQLLALVDIPLYGVKAGDLGGFVTDRRSLSQEGSCWVARYARVYGKVKITDDAYIGDNARVSTLYAHHSVTIGDQAQVTGDAMVGIVSNDNKKFADRADIEISGHALVGGNVVVADTCTIKDNAVVMGNFKLDCVMILGNSQLSGNITVGKGVTIRGNSRISENAVIGYGVQLNDCMVSGYAKIADFSLFKSETFHQKDAPMKTASPKSQGGALKAHLTPKVKNTTAIASMDAKVHLEEQLAMFKSSLVKNVEASAGPSLLKVVEVPTDHSKLDASQLESLYTYLDEVEGRISSYQIDIVKIIKYPLMTDQTSPYTRNMTLALNKVRRMKSMGRWENFEDAITELEGRFLEAESNAIMVSATGLSEEARKRTIKAKDLFSIASDDASTEHEKKVAFVQGFKQLEGVINVPEIAMDTFRGKIGLKEIEE